MNLTIMSVFSVVILVLVVALIVITFKYLKLRKQMKVTNEEMNRCVSYRRISLTV